ncbi:hypothetical protein Tco_0795452 [Tanacetum coccineum]
MTSDHNCSVLGIHDHSNKQLSSKLVPKSCSLSKQDSYITTRVGITIPPSYSNAEDNRFFKTYFNHKVVRLGINPMIQPEPEDLPKDNPKLEIAVLRMKKKCMDKGSKERIPPHNLRQKPGQYICCQNHKLIADIENDIMDPVMQCTTLPNHSGFSQQKLVSFVTEIHTLSIDISLRDYPTTTKEITLAQALEALKTSKPNVKGIIFQEPEPVKPMKKKDQISFDEETALKLQAKFDEEERLAREKAEKEKKANIALIEEWDDIQAKIDADHQLAEILQAQEQE